MITLSTMLGMLINYVGVNPIAALYWTAIINGVLSPPLLIIIMMIADDESIMGDKKNGGWTNILGWATTGLMLIAALALIFI